MLVTERMYQELAAADQENRLEVHHGRLREKPAMSYRHNDVSFELGFELRRQIDPSQFRVRVQAGRVRRADVTYYIPDVMIIPTAVLGPERSRPDVLEVYDVPLPLVVEVWSPSTGDYDVDAKIPEYQRRGDLEIWRLHPFERTLTAWRRQPDGSYTESVMRAGTVRPAALPGVVIDLNALFG